MAIRASSSSFSYRFTYDVFLSFRGEDTRYGFTGYLYDALRNRGIHAFIDDQELPRGDEITPALEKAIEESRIFIIVLSQNYASSSFCLNELAYILNFIKGKGLLVLPVFYNVDPSHVRHHRGSFGEALADHEKKFNTDTDSMDKLKTWKAALHQAANLSGYHFKHKHGDRYEYELIKDIVELVSRKINRAPLHVADYPVGLESRMLEVKSLLDVGSDDVVHMVGIHGLGGVGKTTLATAVYNSIADDFEALCFLENVRETSNKDGLLHLQSNLLSEIVGEIKLPSVRQGISTIRHRLRKKKILLILDDVDKEEQLQAIVGRPDWFGPGSRVIITTRDKQLLACHGVKSTYEMKELDKEHALQLLTWKAFKLEKVDSSYKYVLNQAITYASGLPLALEVIGSNLFGKSIEQWKSALDQYERIPDKEIQEKLRVSYDALKEVEQSVFLDIACCFKKYDLAEVEDILRAHYGHCIKYHIGVLVEKSLIKISLDDKVTLHDLIEDMGKDIVRKESPEPGKRSRLWFPKDIVQVLEENKGTTCIEIIFMDFPLFEKEVEWEGDAFKKMDNLKTLIIRNVLFSKGPKYLPNTLRVLEWWRYPSEDWPYDFHPKKLVICKLPNNGFTSLGLAGLLKKKFVNLTSLNFDECQCLMKIPDLSCLPHLEKLSFQYCKNLATIHSSVGFLEKLKILNARGCCKLRSFPPIKLTSLNQLELSFCRRLVSFPEILGKMENITRLGWRGTPIKKFPRSFRNLTRLQELHLVHTGELRLSGCDTAIFMLNISMMPELAEITAWGCEGWLLPKAGESAEKVISSLSSNVQCLRLKDCKLSDEFFPIVLPWFANVKELDLPLNNFKVIPESIKECHFLTSLNLDNCKHLREIRGIPPNLEYFSAKECLSLSFTCISMLLKQELHEAGNTIFYLPRACIPEWFEYQTSEPSISFQFRNNFRAIAICVDVGPQGYPSSPQPKGGHMLRPIVIINGNRHLFSCLTILKGHTYLFDLQKMRPIDSLDEPLLENEWNHAEIIFEDCNSAPIHLYSGIHILKQQSSMEDIQITRPTVAENVKTSQRNKMLNISMMPELAEITAWGCEGWLLPKAGESAEIGFSKFFPIVLPWFANVKELDLPLNNFKVIPESIKECHFLTSLNLDNCKHLREIRGIPPNLEYFSAKECLSLSFTCISMLLKQELHEAGNTIFYLPGAWIPEWFEYQTSEPSISFQFRNNFPAIAICVDVGPQGYPSSSQPKGGQMLRPIVIINGNRHLFSCLTILKGHTYLFDLQKMRPIDSLDEPLLENEWNHAEIIFEDCNSAPIHLYSGIHILKLQSSMEDIQITRPTVAENAKTCETSQRNKAEKLSQEIREWTRKEIRRKEKGKRKMPPSFGSADKRKQT